MRRHADRACLPRIYPKSSGYTGGAHNEAVRSGAPMNFALFSATRLRSTMSMLSLLVALSVVVASSSSAQAQAAGGDINISPKRVVFDAAGHGATVYVFNRGTAPATYSISVIDRVMTPEGAILAVD